MSDATDLHNKLAGKIVRSIVEPILEQGGQRTAILVLAESVMTGVVEFCARNDDVSRTVVAEQLFDGVRRRLEEIVAR